MTTTTGKLITAEEFARMPDPPDGSRQELVRGVIETMPPPGAKHGVCCARLSRRLGNFVEERNLGPITTNDTDVVLERDPDTVRGPDISFWQRERLTEIPEGYIEVPPDLAVEVVSPRDSSSRIRKKVRHYLDSGVRLVWVLDPEACSVTCYRSLKDVSILMETERLEGGDVVPGFSCRVGDLFA
jgi:Uma2 family endonuclease